MVRRTSLGVGAVLAAAALLTAGLATRANAVRSQSPDLVPASVASGVLDPTLISRAAEGPVDVVVSFSAPLAVDRAIAAAGADVAPGEELPAEVRVALPEQFSALKRATFDSLLSRGVSVREDFANLNSVIVHLDGAEALKALLSRSDVTSVSQVRKMQVHLAETLPYIGQPQVANGNPAYRGAGTYVGVFDTGVDYTRSAFGSCSAPGGSCKVAGVTEATQADDGALDSDGHGTNVSAIILGVAPDTKLFVADVERSDGFIYTNDVLTAVNWLVGRKNAGFNVRAVNMSFGGDNFVSNCADDSGIGTLLANGIQPVASAGNTGYNAGSSQVKGIGGPACIAGVLSVGMTYGQVVNGPGSIGWGGSPPICIDSLPVQPDTIACVSSSAPILSMLAPGYSVTAGGLTLSGTSMASPHVAGAVAVLAGAQASATPAQLRSALTSSGVQVFDSRIGRSFPRLYLPAAVNAIGPSNPPPTSSSTTQASTTQASTTSRATTTQPATTQPPQACSPWWACFGFVGFGGLGGGGSGGTTQPTTTPPSSSTTQPIQQSCSPWWACFGFGFH